VEDTILFRQTIKTSTLFLLLKLDSSVKITKLK
jgi:hypothetical protein